MREISADCCWSGRVPPRPDPICARLYRALEFGHSGSVNPKGCQRVAGGRRGFPGAATSGQRRRRSPAPRLGCQTRHCRACSRLVLPQRIELAPFSHGLDLLQPEGGEAYIAAQEEPHRQRTFEQELRELLEKHGVQYDPKYLL